MKLHFTFVGNYTNEGGVHQIARLVFGLRTGRRGRLPLGQTAAPKPQRGNIRQAHVVLPAGSQIGRSLR